jgi:hypothetical protein
LVSSLSKTLFVDFLVSADDGVDSTESVEGHLVRGLEGVLREREELFGLDAVRSSFFF